MFFLDYAAGVHVITMRRFRHDHRVAQCHDGEELSAALSLQRQSAGTVTASQINLQVRVGDDRWYRCMRQTDFLFLARRVIVVDPRYRTPSEYHPVLS